MEKCWDNVINPAMENIDEYSSLVEPYFTEEKGIRHYHVVNAILDKYAMMVEPEYFYKILFHTQDYYIDTPFFDEVADKQYELREKRGECAYLTFVDEKPHIELFNPMFRKDECGQWAEQGINKYVAQGDAKKFYIYPASFHVGTHHHISTQDRFINYLYAFCVDIDDVKEKDLYKLFENDWDKENSAIPKPTFIVNSGGGIHLYYVLTEPLKFRAHNQRLASRLSETMQEYFGTVATKKATLNIGEKSQGKLRVAQPLRAPGSLTKKGELVTVYQCSTEWDRNILLKEFNIADEEFWTDEQLPLISSNREYLVTNRIKKTRTFVNYLVIDIPIQSSVLEEFISNMDFLSTVCKSADLSEAEYCKNRDKAIKYFKNLHEENDGIDFSMYYKQWLDKYNNAEVGVRYEWDNIECGLSFSPKSNVKTGNKKSYYNMLSDVRGKIRNGHRFWTIVAFGAKAKKCGISWEDYLIDMEQLYADICSYTVRNNLIDEENRWDTFTQEDYESALKLAKSFYFSEKYVRSETIEKYIGSEVAGNNIKRERKSTVSRREKREININYILGMMESFFVVHRRFPNVKELAVMECNIHDENKEGLSLKRDYQFFSRYYDDVLSIIVTRYGFTAQNYLRWVKISGRDAIVNLKSAFMKKKKYKQFDNEAILQFSDHGYTIKEIMNITGLGKTSVYNALKA